MTIGFTNCNKDDDPFAGLQTSWFDGTITAQVENGNAYNNFVKRVMTKVWDKNDNSTALASAPYANGGFTLTLPQTVEAEFLSPFDDDEFGSDLKISDKSALLFGMGGYGDGDIGAYSSASGDFDDNDRVGRVVFAKNEFEGNEETGTGTYIFASAGFIYADRDVAIVGTVTWSDTWDGVTYTLIEKYSISLKKGWNIMYATSSSRYVNWETQTTSENHFTTAPVSGLKWYGDMYNVYGSPAKQAKSVLERGLKRFGRLGR